MRTSASINEIVPALLAAQRECKNVGFDSKNPHFGNQYASLPAVLDTVMPVLHANDLALVHNLGHYADGITCTPILFHGPSAQWIEFHAFGLPLGDKRDAQKAAGASTYARRYTLLAVMGVTADYDDDGESAVGRGADSKTKPGVKARVAA